MLISSRFQALLKEGSYPINFIYCTVHKIKEFCWIGFVLPESSFSDPVSVNPDPDPVILLNTQFLEIYRNVKIFLIKKSSYMSS